jgi:hypothetical protein
MAVVEFDDPTNCFRGDMRIVLVDFVDVASAFEILHDDLRLHAGALDDGFAVHLSGDDLDLIALHPIHRCTSIPIVAVPLYRVNPLPYSAAMAWRSAQKEATPPRDAMQEFSNRMIAELERWVKPWI